MSAADTATMALRRHSTAGGAPGAPPPGNNRLLRQERSSPAVVQYGGEDTGIVRAVISASGQGAAALVCGAGPAVWRTRCSGPQRARGAAESFCILQLRSASQRDVVVKVRQSALTGATMMFQAAAARDMLRPERTPGGADRPHCAALCCAARCHLRSCPLQTRRLHRDQYICCMLQDPTAASHHSVLRCCCQACQMPQAAPLPAMRWSSRWVPALQCSVTCRCH